MDANSDYENSSSSSEDDSFNASLFKKSKINVDEEQNGKISLLTTWST